MSNEASIPSFNSEGGEHDPFVGLDVFAHDPFFQNVLDVVKQKQTELDAPHDSDSLTDDEIGDREEAMLAKVDKSLDEINEMLDECEWIGSTVYITGKLRVSLGMSDALLETEYFKDNTIHVDEDELGVYYYVNDLPMAMGIVSINEGAHDNQSEYILTFHTPGDILERSDSEELVEDLLETAGSYAVHPNDLEMLRFEDPSVFQIERTLRLYYPDVYQILSDTFPEEVGPSAAHIFRKLKALTLPENNNYDAEVLSQIGRFVAYKINSDKEAGYRFILNSPIKGVNAQGALVDSKTGKGDRASGVISSYAFDPETLRAQMVVVDHAPSSDGFELNIIPVDAVDRMHNTRPARSKFGAAAMKIFATIEDAKVFWEKGRDTTDHSQDLFDELDFFMSEASKQYVFNEREGCYELSISDDVHTLYESFVDHLQSSADLGVEAIDMDSLSEAIKADYAALKELSLGDTVMTQQKAVILVHDQDDIETKPRIGVLENNQHIKGECIGFVVTPCPSEVMIETNGEIRSFAPGLVMVLENATIFDTEGEDKKDSPVAVMIAPYLGTTFTKAQAVQS